MPKSDFLRKIVRMVRVPVVSVSLNLGGEPVFDLVDFLAKQILTKNNPDLIINGEILNNHASKIIDLTSGKLIIIWKII